MGSKFARYNRFFPGQHTQSPLCVSYCVKAGQESLFSRYRNELFEAKTMVYGTILYDWTFARNERHVCNSVKGIGRAGCQVILETFPPFLSRFRIIYGLFTRELYLSYIPFYLVIDIVKISIFFHHCIITIIKIRLNWIRFFHFMGMKNYWKDNFLKEHENFLKLRIDFYLFVL